MNRQARLLILRQVSVLQPWRRAFNAHAFAGQKVADKAFAQLDVGQLIARRRVEQAGAKTQLAAGGDGGGHAERCRNIARHEVHAPQATEQRHHSAAVFSHGQHGGFFALFQQQRCQGANHNARGAQGNQWRALLIELTQGRAEFAVGTVCPLNPCGQTVDQRAGVNLLEPARSRQAALAQNHNRRGHQPCHLSPGTMISEKYGDDIGST